MKNLLYLLIICLHLLFFSNASSEDEFQKTNNSVEDAKRLVKNKFKLDTVRFITGPIWCDFTNQGTDNDFYVIYENSKEGSNYEYFVDIFSKRNGKTINIYHKSAGPSAEVNIYNIANERFFIWKMIEGSGAYLTFNIISFRKNSVVEITSSSLFTFDAMGGADLLGEGANLSLKTKNDLYKFVPKGREAGFLKVNTKTSKNERDMNLASNSKSKSNASSTDEKDTKTEAKTPEVHLAKKPIGTWVEMGICDAGRTFLPCNKISIRNNSGEFIKSLTVQTILYAGENRVDQITSFFSMIKPGETLKDNKKAIADWDNASMYISNIFR